MLNLNRRLAELEARGERIRVALVGAGQMGRGVLSQIQRMRGISTVFVADVLLENAVRALRSAGVPQDGIVRVDSAREAEKAIAAGRCAVATDGRLAADLEAVDVIIEATGVPESGAEIAFMGLLAHKHVVMLNVEADATVGPCLQHIARSSGVVYTLTAGDEPGAIKEIYDFADALGFRIIAAGKGKNNPLDRHATPESVREVALSKGVNPKMYCSFVDGSKTMVEMTAVANATGLLPDVRGMHGPRATLQELAQVFSLQEKGGVLHREGVVDYAQGIAPGVFVVFCTDSEVVREEMDYLMMGSGPNYVLYRPYHLCSLETPLSAARAVLYGEPTICPQGAPVAETVAVAKRDLAAGEHLDGIGGYTVYGTIELVDEARKEGLLPLGLVDSKTVVGRPIERGQVITYDDVVLNEDSAIVAIRKMQERILRAN